jgi:hypothetical protein
MKNELATTQPQASTVDLIRAVIDSGINAESVGVVERLVALREREQALAAEREFAAAFAKLQADMPQIVASKAVPDNSGAVRYTYAPYEEIMTKARATLTECGFGITFDTSIADGRVTVTCTLIHSSGHSRSNKFQCRIGSGPPKASEAQGDGAATTYAKRFALCAALNIVVEQDDSDARNEGDLTTITREQAADLRLRCEETTTDMQKFCTWLGVTSFDDIKAKDWERADAKLKERAKK